VVLLSGRASNMQTVPQRFVGWKGWPEEDSESQFHNAKRGCQGFDGFVFLRQNDYKVIIVVFSTQNVYTLCAR
jgi:hypothetical protein